MDENFVKKKFLWNVDNEIEEAGQANNKMADVPVDSNKERSLALLTPMWSKNLNKPNFLWTNNKEMADEKGGMIEKNITVPTDSNEESRKEIIDRIERTVLFMIEQICSGIMPTVSYFIPCQDALMQFSSPPGEDVDGEDEKFTMPSEETTEEFEDAENFDETTRRKTVVNFAQRRSRDKFALMTAVMAKVHLLMITKTTMTRRSFYYELKNTSTGSLAPFQRNIDQTVNHVANLLNCAPWDLRLLASAKGLIAGDLSISLADGKVIDCTVPGGVLIPQSINDVTFMRTNAKFVLVVEKDSVFQILLEERCPEELNCVLITGKGYPDVATRMLVKILSEELTLPVYVLVDADPFGFDIMCVYRFGSLTLSKENDSLACPNVRWLGIHPSELPYLLVATCPLTENDLSKLSAIRARSYMTEAFWEEIEIMRKGKAEIEAVSTYSQRFLTSTYLPGKIKGRKYI